MKILNINSLYNINPIKTFTKSTANVSSPIMPAVKLRGNLNCDVVSFGAKKYDAASILNPTNHCAYCGCKVYDDKQIESIAKEILSNKAGRLEGKVKSVLEKLSGAKNSQEIEVAKKLENEDEIEFFRKFLAFSNDKSFLTGEEIFKQIYDYDTDEALRILKKNMHPLLSTIDHVSPQNENNENQNSDINLVEACYCCNHDLKKGTSFYEFFKMYPSIKNNMPAEKFSYAQSQMSDEDKKSFFSELSVSNMLKFADRLIFQQKDAANYYSTANFRLNDCKHQIEGLISHLEEAISQKENDINGLQSKYDELCKNDEFTAILKRIKLQADLDEVKANLDNLYKERTKIREEIKSLEDSLKNMSKTGSSKKSRKAKKKEKLRQETLPLSPKDIEEINDKINSLNNDLEDKKTQISQNEEKSLQLQVELESLNNKFATLDMLETRKKYFYSIINKYIQLEKIKRDLPLKEDDLAKLTKDESECSEELKTLPSEKFDIKNYSEDEQEIYNKYLDILNVIKAVGYKADSNSVKGLIRSYAKIQAEIELQKLINQPVVIAYKQSLRSKELENQKFKIQEQKKHLQNEIERIKIQIKSLENETAIMPKKQADDEYNKICGQIRTINELSANVRTPQIIDGIKAEIELTRKYIENLNGKYSKIEDVLSSET